jgi:hypothetical protein
MLRPYAPFEDPYVTARSPMPNGSVIYTTIRWLCEGCRAFLPSVHEETVNKTRFL